MSVRFGTDGVRGVAGVDLTAEIALALGRAAAIELRPKTFLVGRDTRQSGPMLFGALAAGLAAEGVDVIDVGVIPTPGLAYLAAANGVPAAMISASHNPYTDNGIKLISSDGRKVPEELERAIERRLDEFAPPRRGGGGQQQASAIGSIRLEAELSELYVTHLLSSVDVAAFRPLSVVVDCANGAASPIAADVLARAGVLATVINAEPNGTNINTDCGSTSPLGLAKSVVANKADLGLAFDGDADRLVAVDEFGEIVDGDVLLALFAFDLQRRGTLARDRIAVTVMSNLGLHRTLHAHGVEVTETPVGDRNVSDALDEGGLVLGGEQSGHIIFRRDATTGDGILTALKLLELVSASGRSLSEVVADAGLVRLPQELSSVRVADPSRLASASRVWTEVERISASFGDDGRVLVRASGTEPVVRIMVEALTRNAALEAIEQIAVVVREELDASSAS